jgi:hypothetical protein
MGGGIRRKLFGTVCACLLACALYLGAATPASAAACPNEAARIQQSAQGLANCRAYEMVSPLDKENGDVQTIIPARAAPDGEALEYEASTAFADSEGSTHANQYVSRRGPNGWSTESLNPFQTPDPVAWLHARGYFALTSDLGRGVLVSNHDPNNHSGEMADDQKRLYLWTKGGSYLPISPPAIEKPFVFATGPLYAGSSQDMERIFFESESALLPEAPAFTNEVYEWHDGNVQIVSRMEGDEVAPQGANVGRGAAAADGIAGAVSGDGSQVVLSSGKQLYLRENGQTIPISVSQVEGEAGTPAPHGATYMGSASEDGQKLSTVYFASPDLLTDEAEGRPIEASANELYAFDVATGALRFLSINTSGATGKSAKVYPKWVGSSDDGSYVYFIADGKLTPDALPSNNFYLWHDETLRYLGSAGGGSVHPNATVLMFGIAQVSADGKRLAYRQQANSNSIQPPLVPGAPNGINLIYLYDATSNRWTCVSCNPDGPTTHEGLFSNLTAGFPGLESAWYSRHNLLPDGSRLYFETDEALVPGDTNGVRDVYEWHEGQINLVSSGRGTEGAHFLDAGADGRDVFIGTRERLAPQDNDAFVDAYDAREGGGFLYEGPLKPCEGDSCQGPASSAPAAVTPGSASVVGGGKVKHRRAARCAKPQKAKAKAKAKKGAKGKRGAKKGRARAAKAKPPRCVKHRKATRHKAHARHRANLKGKGGSR